MPKVVVGGARIELRPDGIIHAVAEKRQKHTLEDAKAITAAVREMTGGKLLPMLLDMTVTGGVESAAQKYYNEQVSVSALAVMTTSSLGRVIGNFVVGMSEGQLPVRLFGDEASAVAWLKVQPKK